jgi:N-carbamoyl-L-amino-acid hydrolase
MADIRVDGERLWQSLMTMAEIGATPAGGVNRQTLTDEDKRGRDLFRAWCEEAGLQVSVDRMGSMFARRQGTDADRPPVMLGSHLDSQPTGGKFDGALGVLAALEVVRTLNDHGAATRAPLEVVNWTNEEGCRIPPAMIASGVFADVFDLDHGLSRRDHAGRTIGDELRRIGYAGERPVGQRPVGALFELHIEQGPILEAEGQRIGIVTGAQGARWYDCAVTGAETHAGAAPMAGRRDALRGAAALLEDIYAVAQRHAPAGRATIGEFQAYPGSRNTVPGRVRFTVDLRHPDGATMDAMDRALRDAFERAHARSAGLEFRLDEIWYAPPVAFDPQCIEAVRQAAAGLGLTAREIVSGAGHDAVYMARIVPTAMIFVPCKDGISHAEVEYAAPEACADGASVLLHAVLARAGA